MPSEEFYMMLKTMSFLSISPCIAEGSFKLGNSLCDRVEILRSLFIKMTIKLTSVTMKGKVDNKMLLLA